MQNNHVTYFDSFSVEHIPKEIKEFLNRPPLRDTLQNEKTTTNIFRIQAYKSIMYKYLCIGFIDFMLARKTLYANLFHHIQIFFHQIIFRKMMIKF